MQEDPLTGPQSAMIAGGQFYGTYLQMHTKSIVTNFIVISECPNGHKTFIGNVSLIVRHCTMQLYNINIMILPIAWANWYVYCVQGTDWRCH
jgi:hypothetical protein